MSRPVAPELRIDDTTLRDAPVDVAAAWAHVEALRRHGAAGATEQAIARTTQLLPG